MTHSCPGFPTHISRAYESLKCSVIAPTPAMWLSVPDMRMDLVGEHAAAVWTKDVRTTRRSRAPLTVGESSALSCKLVQIGLGGYTWSATFLSWRSN